MAKMNAITKLMREAWRKANRDGVVEIRCQSAARAATLRFGLYNAVRDVRKRVCQEEELCEAVANCSAGIEKREEISYVVIRRFDSREEFIDMARALGGNSDGALSEVIQRPQEAIEGAKPEEIESEDLNARAQLLLERIKRGEF